MRTLVPLLTLVVLVGCTNDNSHLSITPGYGISNVLTLDMTLEEIRKIEGAHVTEHKSGTIYCVEIPWLGANWEQYDSGSPIRIDFYVPSHFEPGRLHDFIGKLDNKISFVSVACVTTNQIMSAYGIPEHTIDWDSALVKHGVIQLITRVSI
jgi:hypothetical protein